MINSFEKQPSPKFRGWFLFLEEVIIVASESHKDGGRLFRLQYRMKL